MRLWMAAVAIAMASPAQAQETAEFSVGGVRFELALPDGFCLPTGDAAVAAAVLASADTMNVTLLTVVKCEGEPFENDYFALKSPISTVGMTIERDDFLKMMEPEFGTARNDGAFAGATDQAADLLSDRLGQRITMQGKIEPLGMDDFCVYLGGNLAVQGPGESYAGALGGCITAIGGKIVSAISVGRGDVPADVARHLRFSRMIAERIRVKE